MLTFPGKSRGRAGVNFNSRDFYMRDMNRDGTGDVDRESDAESCNADGEDNDRNEEQRQGTCCKSFEEFHQSGCAFGF